MKKQHNTRKVLQLPTTRWQPKTFKLPAGAKRFSAQPTRGVMNKTEHRYAEHLEQLRHVGTVVDWQFEPISIKLAEDLRYIPDFLVIKADGSMEIVDVKGTTKNIQDDSLVKIKMVADLWWFATVKFAFPCTAVGWLYRVFPTTRWQATQMKGINNNAGAESNAK
jgi:hypothetical protein